MFLCVNVNFHSPVESMLIIPSDKKIGSVSHARVVEWPVSLSVSETSSYLYRLPTSTACVSRRSLSVGF